jgi:hypothetical protein
MSEHILPSGVVVTIDDCSGECYLESPSLNKAREMGQALHEACDESARLKERIKELENERKWISVEDRLPDPEVPVLGIVNGFDGILTLERRWEICDPYSESYYKDFLYWDWTDNDGQDFEGLVTHWMPLLELPELPRGDV